MLQVAVFTGFPPFAYRQHGILAGLEIELLRKFAAGQGWRLEFSVQPFEGLWDRVARGHFDLAAAGISIAQGREAIWSEPHAEVRRAALVLAARETVIRDYNEIRRMAVVPGSAAHVHARKHLRAGSLLVEVSSLGVGLELLLAGVVEAVGTGSVSAFHHARARRELAVLDLHRPDEPVEDIAFAVRAHPVLRRKLDRFILGAKTPII